MKMMWVEIVRQGDGLVSHLYTNPKHISYIEMVGKFPIEGGMFHPMFTFHLINGKIVEGITEFYEKEVTKAWHMPSK